MIHRLGIVPLLAVALVSSRSRPALAQMAAPIAPAPPLRTAGAVVTVAGVAVAGVAGALFLYAVPKRLSVSDGCDSPCDVPPFWYVEAGLIGLGAGTVLAVSGLIMIASSADRPPSSVAQLAQPPERSWRVAPVLDGRWSGLALMGRF